MTRTITQLVSANQAWAERMTAQDPAFFQRLSTQQRPDFLWIGCSDSRVPATQLVDMLPGEMFVHRNVANIVVHSDLNCLAVLQFAVEVLGVHHIIVCGHYGCGGVEAALHNRTLGLIDNWLRHVQDVAARHPDRLDACQNDTERLRRLCELNVVEQVVNVCQTTIVQGAWRRGQGLAVHGLIYDVADGRLRDVGISVAMPDDLASAYERTLASLAG